MEGPPLAEGDGDALVDDLADIDDDVADVPNTPLPSWGAPPPFLRAESLHPAPAAGIRHPVQDTPSIRVQHHNPPPCTQPGPQEAGGSATGGQKCRRLVPHLPPHGSVRALSPHHSPHTNRAPAVPRTQPNRFAYIDVNKTDHSHSFHGYFLEEILRCACIW